MDGFSLKIINRKNSFKVIEDEINKIQEDWG